ncbi:unnamed protein product [Lathyrus oleraceus]
MEEKRSNSEYLPEFLDGDDDNEVSRYTHKRMESMHDLFLKALCEDHQNQNMDRSWMDYGRMNKGIRVRG